jgi:hypothetical protein
LKTIFDGRWPQNIRDEYINNHWLDLPKFKLRGSNQNQKCLKWGWPPMEIDPKISNVEFLSNQWSDLPQIKILCQGNNRHLKCLKLRQTSMENNLKILSLVSQQPVIQSSSNFKFKLRETKKKSKMIEIKMTSNGMLNVSATPDQIFLKCQA